jgi:Lon protease-like protein
MSEVLSPGTFVASALPATLAIFPLSGSILLPGAQLPLNIFEARYKSMIEYALGHDRLLGLIQSTTPDTQQTKLPSLYKVGCVGRIISFNETDDGRFMIALTGVCRFAVAEEFPAIHPWRHIRSDWSAYLGDLKPPLPILIDRTRLMNVLRPYLRDEGIRLDMEVVDKTPDDVLIAALVMICPLEPNEKQALLEAQTPQARADLLIALLEMATMPLQDKSDGGAKH